MKLTLTVLGLALYYQVRIRYERIEVVLQDVQMQPPFRTVEPKQIEHACNRVRARTGLTCLPVALAMRHVMRASGQDARLVMGVNPDDFSDGHAWVEGDGSVFLRGSHDRKVAWRETA